MKIKTKLTYGIGILFILILILGVVAGKYITDMSTDTRNILADNYQSLSYARQMLYSLENIGKDTAAVNVFIDNLRKQQNNITEKDEAEVTTRLMMHFEQFKKDTGQLVVSYIIFYGIPLHNVQSREFIWPVICLIAIICIFTLITARIKMPAINVATRPATQSFRKSIWSFPQLRLGVIGIFCYVGVEVAVGANINLYAVSLNTTLAAAATKMAALYWTGILVGRFAGSLYTKISSQNQLIYSSIGSIILLLLAMFFANPWILVFTGLCHSVMWPAIYTLALDKLGIYTAKASGALMIGVVGGGILPLLQGILADALHGDWRWTWGLILAGEIYILYYGLSGYKAQSATESNPTPHSAPPSRYK